MSLFVRIELTTFNPNPVLGAMFPKDSSNRKVGYSFCQFFFFLQFSYGRVRGLFRVLMVLDARIEDPNTAHFAPTHTPHGRSRETPEISCGHAPSLLCISCKVQSS